MQEEEVKMGSMITRKNDGEAPSQFGFILQPQLKQETPRGEVQTIDDGMTNEPRLPTRGRADEAWPCTSNMLGDLSSRDAQAFLNLLE